MKSVVHMYLHLNCHHHHVYAKFDLKTNETVILLERDDTHMYTQTSLTLKMILTGS